MRYPDVRMVWLVVVLSLLACTRSAEPATAETLRTMIDAYRDAKPDATEERVDALFARLDAELARARADAPDAEQTAALERQRRELQQAWLAARLARAGTTAGDALRGLGESLGRGLEDAGRRLRESMREQGAPAPER